METAQQHGNDFNEKFTEILTIDPELYGGTGQEGYHTDMSAIFVNTDNSTAVDTNAGQTIAINQTISHAATNL